jgi:transcriptional regulator with XRE-family HTH domain
MNLEDLGKAIRQARKQKHWTQADLGEQLGMSRATVSAIENGTVNEIGIRKVMALCSLLGLELQVQTRQTKRPTLHTLVSEADQRKRNQ